MGERVEGDVVSGTTMVGIIGGTGGLGHGLARRLAIAGHDVVIGSRDAGRARQVARSTASGVTGGTNAEACAAEVVLLTVPWEAHAETLEPLREAIADRVLVDCVNPLGFDGDGPFALTVPEGSACEQAQRLLPAARVVGAFHHVSARLLLGDASLATDVMVVGDDDAAVQQVTALADSIAGLRGVYAGRLRDARQVEALTANLIALNRRYRVHAGVRITGLAGDLHS